MNIDIKIVIPIIMLIVIVVILLSRHIIFGSFILYKIYIFTLSVQIAQNYKLQKII